MLKKICKNIGIIMAVLFTGLLFGIHNPSVHAFTTNPTPTRQYVVDDYDDDLSDMTKELVIHQEKHYQEDTITKPQVVMMTVPTTNGDSATGYSDDLLRNSRWHFGNKQLNNGVLILFARNHGKNNVYISTGYGVEGILPDLKCDNFLEKNKKLLKSHNKSKVNEGLQNVFFDVTKTLNHHYAHLSKSQAKALLAKQRHKHFIKHVLDAIGIIVLIIILAIPYNGTWFCLLWFLLRIAFYVLYVLLLFVGNGGGNGGDSGGFSDSGHGGNFGGGGAGI